MTPPDAIYLTWPAEDEDRDMEDILWCDSPIEADDPKFIRADIVEAKLSALSQELAENWAKVPFVDAGPFPIVHTNCLEADEQWKARIERLEKQLQVAVGALECFGDTTTMAAIKALEGK